MGSHLRLLSSRRFTIVLRRARLCVVHPFPAQPSFLLPAILLIVMPAIDPGVARASDNPCFSIRTTHEVLSPISISTSRCQSDSAWA